MKEWMTKTCCNLISHLILFLDVISKRADVYCWFNNCFLPPVVHTQRLLWLKCYVPEIKFWWKEGGSPILLWLSFSVCLWNFVFLNKLYEIRVNLSEGIFFTLCLLSQKRHAFNFWRDAQCFYITPWLLELSELVGCIKWEITHVMWFRTY